MGKVIPLEFESRYFTTEVSDDIAIIRMQTDFMLCTADLDFRDNILSYLDRVSDTSWIRSVIMVGAANKKGCEAYFDLFSNANHNPSENPAIHRLYNIIDQVILKLMAIDKIVIHCNQGKIIATLMNVSLACDYRIIAADAVFQNPCIKLGLIPMGGGGFFLPKLVGVRKAFDILLADREISAQEALALGIVDAVVPAGELTSKAVEMARQFSSKPASTIFAVKKLLSYGCKDLKGYLELENQLLLRSMQLSE